MAILSRDDLLSRIRKVIGDDTSDDSIQLIEDVTDTYDNLQNEDAENWKTKYEENDAAWRKKYTDRFFNTGSPEEPDTTPDKDDNSDDEPKPLLYENLFKEEEK